MKKILVQYSDDSGDSEEDTTEIRNKESHDQKEIDRDPQIENQNELSSFSSSNPQPHFFFETTPIYNVDSNSRTDFNSHIRADEANRKRKFFQSKNQNRYVSKKERAANVYNDHDPSEKTGGASAARSTKIPNLFSVPIHFRSFLTCSNSTESNSATLPQDDVRNFKRAKSRSSSSSSQPASFIPSCISRPFIAFEAHASSISKLRFSRKFGSFLATCSGGNAAESKAAGVKLWDLSPLFGADFDSSDRVVPQIPCALAIEESRSVLDFRFSSDSSKVLSGSLQKTVTLTDLEHGNPARQMLLDEMVSSVLFNPRNENLILIGKYKGGIESWDLRCNSYE